MTHYKYWSRLAATEGVAASYSGQYPESYAIYPPVTLYPLGLIGTLYQRLVDPSFDLERALASQGLTFAIRLMALSLHLVLGLILYRLLERPAGGPVAAFSASLYILNPGALWDVAVWAQPDAWFSLFGLLAIWNIGLGRAVAGGAWLGLALATKPQAWLLGPLAGLGLLRGRGAVGTAKAVLSAGLVVGLVVAPFLLQGRLPELLSLPGQISSVMPVASANAHNLWWLVSGGAVPFVLDSDRLPGPLPLSYRQAALLLVLASQCLVLALAWRVRGPWDLACLAAYSVQAWFCLTAGAHENHPFLLFPFLALVAWRSRFLMALLLLLTALFSYNVIGHDFGIAPRLDQALGPRSWRLQQAASGLNLAILAAWTVWLARRAWLPGVGFAEPLRLTGRAGRTYTPREGGKALDAEVAQW